MNKLFKWFQALFQIDVWPGDPGFNSREIFLGMMILLLWIFTTCALIYSALYHHPAYAASSAVTSLPGEDMAPSLEAAGMLLKTLDTGIFQWGARLFAGLCIMSSAWALKEQRFGIAIICVIGAIIFGTAPRWVSDIFKAGGTQSIFSTTQNDSNSCHFQFSKLRSDRGRRHA